VKQLLASFLAIWLVAEPVSALGVRECGRLLAKSVKTRTIGTLTFEEIADYSRNQLKDGEAAIFFLDGREQALVLFRFEFWGYEYFLEHEEGNRYRFFRVFSNETTGRLVAQGHDPSGIFVQNYNLNPSLKRGPFRMIRSLQKGVQGRLTEEAKRQFLDTFLLGYPGSAHIDGTISLEAIDSPWVAGTTTNVTLNPRQGYQRRRRNLGLILSAAALAISGAGLAVTQPSQAKDLFEKTGIPAFLSHEVNPETDPRVKEVEALSRAIPWGMFVRSSWQKDPYLSELWRRFQNVTENSSDRSDPHYNKREFKKVRRLAEELTTNLDDPKRIWAYLNDTADAPIEYHFGFPHLPEKLLEHFRPASIEIPLTDERRTSADGIIDFIFHPEIVKRSGWKALVRKLLEESALKEYLNSEIEEGWLAIHGYSVRP